MQNQRIEIDAVETRIDGWTNCDRELSFILGITKL